MIIHSTQCLKVWISWSANFLLEVQLCKWNGTCTSRIAGNNFQLHSERIIIETYDLVYLIIAISYCNKYQKKKKKKLSALLRILIKFHGCTYLSRALSRVSRISEFISLSIWTSLIWFTTMAKDLETKVDSILWRKPSWWGEGLTYSEGWCQHGVWGWSLVWPHHRS